MKTTFIIFIVFVVFILLLAKGICKSAQKKRPSMNNPRIVIDDEDNEYII